MAASLVTAGGVYLMIGGNHITYPKNRPHYEELVAAIKSNKSDQELLDIVYKEENHLKNEIAKLNDENLTVEDQVIYFQGEPLDGALKESFIEAITHGYPLHPLQNFLYNVIRNPDDHIRKNLFNLLYEAKCPLTEDGNFLAYLPVNLDYTDYRTGKLDHAIGQTISVARMLVNKDLSKAVTFATSFNGFNNLHDKSKRIMVACIAPQDVVVIRPLNVDKSQEVELLASCRYEVTAEYVGYTKSNADVLSETAVITLEHDEVFTVEGFLPLTKEWVRISGANSLPAASAIADEELTKDTYISIRIFNNQGQRPFSVTDNRNYREKSLDQNNTLSIYNGDNVLLRSGYTSVADALDDMCDLSDSHDVVMLKNAAGEIVQKLG